MLCGLDKMALLYDLRNRHGSQSNINALASNNNNYYPDDTQHKEELN